MGRKFFADDPDDDPEFFDCEGRYSNRRWYERPYYRYGNNTDDDDDEDKDKNNQGYGW